MYDLKYFVKLLFSHDINVSQSTRIKEKSLRADQTELECSYDGCPQELVNIANLTLNDEELNNDFSRLLLKDNIEKIGFKDIDSIPNYVLYYVDELNACIYSTLVQDYIQSIAIMSSERFSHDNSDIKDFMIKRIDHPFDDFDRKVYIIFKMAMFKFEINFDNPTLLFQPPSPKDCGKLTLTISPFRKCMTLKMLPDLSNLIRIFNLIKPNENAPIIQASEKDEEKSIAREYDAIDNLYNQIKSAESIDQLSSLIREFFMNLAQNEDVKIIHFDSTGIGLALIQGDFFENMINFELLLKLGIRSFILDLIYFSDNIFPKILSDYKAFCSVLDSTKKILWPNWRYQFLFALRLYRAVFYLYQLKINISNKRTFQDLVNAKYEALMKNCYYDYKTFPEAKLSEAINEELKFYHDKAEEVITLDNYLVEDIAFNLEKIKPSFWTLESKFKHDADNKFIFLFEKVENEDGGELYWMHDIRLLKTYNLKNNK